MFSLSALILVVFTDCSFFDSMYTLKQDALRDFISEAKEHYIETSKQKVIVRSMGGDGGSRMDIWNRVQSKTYRPLESIILPDGVLDTIINDARDFIASEDWYVRAGIPYRRGYLFYGPPGTGKSRYHSLCPLCRPR